MGLREYMNSLFPKPPSDGEIKLRRQKTVCAILSRYSEGNINLNRAKYVSEKHADGLKKKALSYHFK